MPSLITNLILALGLLVNLAVEAAEPYTPASDDTVLERAVVQAGAASLRPLRQQLSANPQDLAAATGFARRAIELGRAEGDPRYFGYAQAALSPWWMQAQPPPQALILRAILLQQRHEFDAALTDLAALLARFPNDPQAHLTRAVILMVRGQPREAQRDCGALVGRAELLTIVSCLGAARSLIGQGDTALTSIASALEQSPNADIGLRLWALTLAAEIAERLGRDADAESYFTQALRVAESSGERDAYLLTAYADFLLRQRRAAEVVPLLRDDTRIDGELLRLALAESRLANAGDAAGYADLAAQHTSLLQSRFDEARLRGEAIHLREEAIFLLHLRQDASAALIRAQQNWAAQREPTDALVLLESALASAQPAAAAPVLQWMRESGIEDRRLEELRRKLASSETPR